MCVCVCYTSWDRRHTVVSLDFTSPPLSVESFPGGLVGNQSCTVPSRVRVSSVTMYHTLSGTDVSLTALRMSHVLSHHVCGSLALRMSHPYCPTDVTHIVLCISPILSFGCHLYYPTYITHIVLRISHLKWLRMSPILSYGCHPYCLTDVPPILSYACPTYAVLRMSPMLSQHMCGSLALLMSHPYCPTDVPPILSHDSTCEDL